MKKFLKKFIPQRVINNFYHFPKAVLANFIYGFPTRNLKVIGVTGTDGKTTTVNMIYHILKKAGIKVSMLSTINAVSGGKVYDTGFHVTSPDPFTIQRLAKKAFKAGDEYLVLEVTSHALDQFRFWGIKFYAGIITNITHDHLDYHKSYKNYFKTKLKLIKKVRFAVLNQAIQEEGNVGTVGEKTITFGIKKGDFNQKDVKLKLKLIGDYNIENALAALSVAYILNIPKKIAQTTLEEFESIPGRMEEVKNSKGIKVIIDFAHTPNGLEQALTALRSHFKSGRLIAVFGSASERDILKRSIMGEISGKLSDISIITDEDPRFEASYKIIDEIAKGAIKAGSRLGVSLFKEADRQKAIDLAITLAKKGDIVGIFGKGHEKSINYKGAETVWSDFEAAKKALYGKQI